MAKDETGASKPIFKRVWFWILIIVLVAGIGSAMGNRAPSDEEKASIEYTAVTVDELTDALEANAAAAKDTYSDKYVEISGKLSTIDSDLKYISVASAEDAWNFRTILCNIKDDATKEKVKTLSSDQEITVRGKITEVGEVLGYTMDLYEIV